MKTVLIGLGNPILGDDGVGWKVAENVKEQLTSSPALLARGEGREVDVNCLSLGGLSLMEHLIGYQRVILVDSFIAEENIGSVHVYKLNDIPNYSAFHITSVHDTSLQSALELGRWMGAILPDDITVVGIAIKHIVDFSEELSQPVEEAVPRATQVVLELLKQFETA